MAGPHRALGMRGAGFLLLLATPAAAQVAIPVGTPGIVIPGGNSPGSIRYQVQGSGFACVSWLTSAITITGTSSAATCTGQGAFLVTQGSADQRLRTAPVPSLAPLYGVAATGATLQVASETLQ